MPTVQMGGEIFKLEVAFVFAGCGRSRKSIQFCQGHRANGRRKANGMKKTTPFVFRIYIKPFLVMLLYGLRERDH